MRLEESVAIKEILDKHQSGNDIFKIVINLGSGDVQRLVRTKPWVNENVIQPLVARQSKIMNVDVAAFPGVDLVQDLSLPNALDFVDGTPRPRLFVLSNVLEHIPASARPDILDKIYRKMDEGDSFLITAPFDYPYHPDPIDTMYRVHPDQLVELLPLDWKEKRLVSSGSYREEFGRMKFLKKVRKLLKPFVIFQSPKKWMANHRLLYLFKDYKISIVFGSK